MSDDDESGDGSWGWYDGECVGCETYGQVNDLGLCPECAAKLDRDLIRQRDWDYSASAFGVPKEKLEDLRRQVIRQYGERLELIAPYKKTPPRRFGRTRKARGARPAEGRRPETSSEPEHSPAAKAAILEVVNNQLRDGTPPETRQTFERLVAAGHSEQQARELIGAVVASEIWHLLKEKRPYDQARFVAALQRLAKLPWDE